MNRSEEFLLRVLTALSLSVVSLSAGAHHSFGLYTDEITEMEGELMDVRWGNPHVRFTMKTANEAGGEETWTLEAAAVYILERRGLNRELFRQGDQVKVAGRLHRRQSGLIWMHNLLVSDGREMLMIGGVDPRWTVEPFGGEADHAVVDTLAQDRGMFRVWSQPVLRPITYGEALPYRENPSPGGAEWIERMDGFAARCEPVGMPGVMATPYPFELIDHGASIQLLGFSNNALIDRTIHMSEAGDSAERASDPMGFSLGRWEGSQRLVVETTRIDWPYFDDSSGTSQSGRIETVEVFSLSNDQHRLDYELIVTDPVTFTEPATAVKTYWLALGESLAEPSYCAD